MFLLLSIWVGDISYFIASSHLVRENLGYSDILMPLRQSETFNCVSLKETTPHLSTQQTKTPGSGDSNQKSSSWGGRLYNAFSDPFMSKGTTDKHTTGSQQGHSDCSDLCLCEKAINYLPFCGNILQNQRALSNIYSSAPSTPCSEESDSVRFSTINSSFQQFMSHLKNILLQREEIWQDFHSDHFRNYEKEIVSWGWHVRGRHRERNQLDGAKQTIGNPQVQPVVICILTTWDLIVSKANSKVCFEGKLAKIIPYKFLCMLCLPFGKPHLVHLSIKNPSARRGGKEKSRTQGIW